jgi:hypothetical protein
MSSRALPVERPGNYDQDKKKLKADKSPTESRDDKRTKAVSPGLAAGLAAELA